MENVNQMYENGNGNGISASAMTHAHAKPGTTETPQETLKRVLQHRVNKAKGRMDLLINTFDQRYPFTSAQIEQVERFLNDCLVELQYTRAAKKFRQENKRYEV
jgi:hypothetical protein